MSGLRSYGLGPSGEPQGAPEVIGPAADNIECPHCQGKNTVFLIQLRVKHELIKGQDGISHYLGCAACPWASPAMLVSTADLPPKG